MSLMLNLLLPAASKANTQEPGAGEKQSGLFKGRPPEKIGNSCPKAHLNISVQVEVFTRRERESRTKRLREGLKSSLCADEHSPF